MITPYMKFNQNLRGRVLFQDFFGRSVVERPSSRQRSIRSNDQILLTVGINLRGLYPRWPLQFDAICNFGLVRRGRAICARMGRRRRYGCHK